MLVDDRLVEKGRSAPRGALVDEALAHVELARRYAPRLAENGWSPADTDALEAAVIDLEPAPGPPIPEGEARDADVAEWAAIGQAKVFLLRLYDVAAVLGRGLPRLLDVLVLEQDPGPSAASLSAYLDKVRPGVALLADPASDPAHDGATCEDLDQVQRELEVSRAREEAQLGTIVEGASTMNEAKGRVLEMIETLDRVAKLAFEGQAAVIELFEEDILVQAQRAHRV